MKRTRRTRATYRTRDQPVIVTLDSGSHINAAIHLRRDRATKGSEARRQVEWRVRQSHWSHYTPESARTQSGQTKRRSWPPCAGPERR